MNHELKKERLMKQFLLLMTLAGLCAMAQTTVLDISFISNSPIARKLMSSTEIHALP